MQWFGLTLYISSTLLNNLFCLNFSSRYFRIVSEIYWIRDAAVPGVIINKGLHDLPSPNLSPVYTPTFSSSPVSELDPHPAVPTPVHPIEPVHLVDPVHPNPIYSPPKPVHVPTKATK